MAVKDLYAYFDKLCGALDSSALSFSSNGIKLENIGFRTNIQMFNLKDMLDAFEIAYIREDWDGNASCDSNWDVIKFNYKGYTFFELVDKEENDEGK